MNDKGFYPQGHSPLDHMQDRAWRTDQAPREFDLPLSRHARLLPTLRRLAWMALAAMLLAGLVTWGFHSRFGLLLLLLLR
ncbi:hypothetical protein [Pseudomonas sp. PH1b]|uniref:hypothetical protein n=1 Tax=Pseudomonas sp. PH1b TaxID=1397282 RepID=UPI000468CCAC|nr:hypothetical protein [Pseudomonas sp. PH1b]BFD43465.1 hypothetical protein FFPRI1PSEUD_49640 [Pseudomonas sp. FFPRI_1]